MDLLKGRGNSQPQLVQGAPAFFVSDLDEGLPILRRVHPHQGTGGLFTDGVVNQARFPSSDHVGGPGPAQASGPVPGQRKPGLLTGPLAVLARPGGPFRRWLVFEQYRLIR